MHVTSCFIRSDIAKKYLFNEDQKYGEDTTYINKIILDKGKYGVLTSALCYYRKRLDETSAVQNQRKNRDWYLKTPEYFYAELINFSKNKYGYVIPYLQSILVYDIQYRIGLGDNFTLDSDEYTDYKIKLKQYLDEVEDEMIIMARSLSVDEKLRMLRFKNGRVPVEHIKLRDNMLTYFGRAFIDLTVNGSVLRVNFIRIEDDSLVLEGVIRKWLFECWADLKLLFSVNDQVYYPVTFNDYDIDVKEVIDGKEYMFRFYSVKIPLSGKKNRVYPIIQFPDGADCRLKMVYAKFMPITEGNPGAVFYSGKYFVRNLNGYLELTKPKNKKKTIVAYEIKALKYLRKKKRLDMARYRITARIRQLFKRKQVWIISDRDYVANDNGEYLFRYLCEHKHDYPDIKPYFAISGESEDYNRLKKYGPVLDIRTRRYKNMYLICDKIISSSANEDAFDAFGKDKNFVKGVYNFRYVFLQHGIIMNDLSGWLNRVNKNISAFITSAKPEYESIRQEHYLYDRQVKLTGLARYDHLIEVAQAQPKEKLILVMPTWRKYIEGCHDPKTSKSLYTPNFVKSNYYEFYNSLINNPKLLDAMRKYGFKGLLGLHPIHSEQAIDFQKNDIFDVATGYLDYQQLFSRGSIMLTDYSSTFFDFCYLRKPVVYAQFDRAEFYNGQIYEEGYFDYDRDGFGPVCDTLSSTVEALIHLMENGACLEPMYEQKINSFYAFNDQNNCKRIVEAILEDD